MDAVIRPTIADDSEILVEFAAATGVFKPHEIKALGEVLYDYFDFERDMNDHRCATIVDDDGPAGFVYFAQDTMTFGTWDMWWIVVDPKKHGRGLGRRLVDHCETEIRSAGGRILFIDTSSLPEYEPTRKFYESLGYEPHAVLCDYFSDGDSKVIFRKRLAQVKM